MILTNVLDVSSYIWLQSRVIPISRSNSIHSVQSPPNNDIPLKASTICSILFIPYILAYIAIGSSQVQPLEKYFLAILLTRLNDAVRNPLTATSAFRVNETNAAEDRERNRQVVIREALKKRQERRQQRKSSVYSIPMETLPPNVVP